MATANLDFFGMVGREGFEPSTYGLRVQLTRISMRRKPKIRHEFFVALPARRPKPNYAELRFDSCKFFAAELERDHRVARSGDRPSPERCNLDPRRWSQDRRRHSALHMIVNPVIDFDWADTREQ